MKTALAFAAKTGLFGVVLMLIASPVFSQLSLRKALDFDGDGKADYAIFRPSNNTWYIARSAGGFSGGPWGSASDDFMTPGDYDGDGKADISVWRDTNGYWYTVNSSNGTVSVNQWGATGDEPVARDYDGDGKTDLAIVRRSGGNMTWWIYRSTAGPLVVNWGLATDFVVPGDFDGDGKFDFTVQRPGSSPSSPAAFYTLFNATGAFSIVNFGITSDIVVPGDYDGDGKTDYAVLREGATTNTGMVWWILRSSDSRVNAYTWGLTGVDLNVQNDYDGDGKTDIAIWRNGAFWIQRSSNLATMIYNFGVANDYPIASYDTH